MARKSNSFLETGSREASREPSSTPPVPPKETKGRGSGAAAAVAKSRKEAKKDQEKEADREVATRSGPESRAASAKKERKSREAADASGLTACSVILAEMEAHEDSWPFRTPVNTKQFPTYKKIIKRPMDLQSMRQKLEAGV